MFAWSWNANTALGLAVYFLGVAISIVFVAKILTTRNAPAVTLLWVTLIIAAPFIGLLLYYLLPRRIRLRRLRQRTARLSGFTPARVASDKVELARHPIASFLAHIAPNSCSGGNAVTILETGEQFFGALEQAIRTATKFVHIEIYILRPDGTGERVLRELTDAARRGVEVRLLYDHIGSWSLKRRHLRALTQAGGKAVPYLPLLWRRRPFTINLRNHRKLAVIDGDTAFVGGRNVGLEYQSDKFGEDASWLDAMVRVCGPGVGPMHAVFAEDWLNASEEELGGAYFPDPGPVGPAWVGTVANGPDRERNVLRHVLNEMVSRARKTIEISSPYFVPHPTICFALETAALRGVRIRLHTNGGHAGNFVLYRVARSHYERLLRFGVEVIETRRDYNHAKMFIVDGKTLYLGSSNLDMRSFELNFELGCLLIEPNVCATALRMFDERSSAGRRIGPEDLRDGRVGRVIDGVFRLFSPVL